jgi:ligand-binding sensor domain-containing protein/AraC-like DNA-binding protein
MIKFRISFLYTLLSLTFSSYGQELSFKTISVENGLSNNFVKAIYKDKAGFVWIGTLEGLDRFDGMEIKSFSQKAMGTRESVGAICEDEEGNLWIGAESGLFVYDRKLETYRKIVPDNDAVKIQVVLAGKDRIIYIGTNKGLYIYHKKNQEIKHVPLEEPIQGSGNFITGIVQDSLSDLWIATLKGLVHLSPSDGAKEIYLCNINHIDTYSTFSGITMVGSDLYLGTKTKGLILFKTLTKKCSLFENIDNCIILTLSGDGKGRLFVGTDGGGLKIVNLKDKHIETISHDVDDPNSMSSNSVYSFLYDDKGMYWIGTFSAGLNYSQNFRKKFNNFSILTRYHSQNKSIRSFYFSPDGDKFLGTRDGFLVVPKNEKELVLYRAEGTIGKYLRANIILTVFPYKDKLLIGTYGGGVCTYDKINGKFGNFLENEEFQKGCIYGFATDGKGNLWIATLNGIYKYNPETRLTEHFTNENSGLLGNEVYAITIDSRDRIWAGTMNGFCFWDQHTAGFSTGLFPKHIPNNFRTTSIYEDKKHNMWLCTEKGGIFWLNPNLSRFVNYTGKDGLPDNSICAIAEDNSGDYWISTLKGFVRFNAANKSFHSFSLSDGLPGLAFNPGACYKSNTGEMWWGNEKGLIYFHPDSITDNSLAPDVRITAFYMAGKEVGLGENSLLKQSIETSTELVLGNRQNSIGFRFVALNYTNPLDNHYLCKLEGYDKDWKQLGNSNEVHYEKLPAGSFVFKVKLADSDSSIKNDGQIAVVIKTPFYVTPYFIVVSVLLFGAGVWLRGIYMANHKIKTEHKSERLVHDKYKGAKIPEDQGAVIKEALIRYMNEKKPYLNAELKLADLADEIHYSAHEISQVLNQYQNQHFSDFVNTYRVEEVKKRMSDKNFSKFTLTAIAQQCGFNSKTSFFRVFKKLTGKTPADYFKESKQGLDMS